MLSNHGFDLHGGCNCSAIRYRISIPSILERPVHPLSPDGSIRFPFSTTDHCNDCRRATGSILPAWLCVPAPMFSVSLRPPPPPDTHHYSTPDNELTWLSADEALRQDSEESQESTVRFFVSSKDRTRSFCGHCGTNVAYAVWPIPGYAKGFPDLFDVVLGTLDREDLERSEMRPERQLWWEKGIEWVQKLSDGLNVPKHKGFRVNEVVY
ncbi:hypothetical protein EV356DRAFT_256508 [Viridothelium virens]|uniref:Uncharacterized protein n=1 Tax=Viridothelium virens TaxID=1048519 RepID=A0A6A6H2L3_VIRVR|nr:hypothetical protein EV356DRAFT_256508 [Viridothelium virens]